MKKMFLMMISLNFMAFSSAPFFKDKEKGWFWYEVAEEKEETAQNERPPTITKKTLPPREVLKNQGKQWEDALATAILRPNRENIIQYLSETKKINEQASNFANEFKKLIWINPQYDYTLENPVSTEAIIATNEKKLLEQKQTLKRMAKDWGILFFFKGECPYCHRFAPIIKKFAAEYGFSLMAVSLDGSVLAEFPRPEKNNQMGRKLNIATVPAVFLVNPSRDIVVAVGYGYSGWTELQEKVMEAWKRVKTHKVEV